MIGLADQQNNAKITEGKTPVGFTKRKKFLFFKIKSKPIYSGNLANTAQPASAAQQQAGTVQQIQMKPLPAQPTQQAYTYSKPVQQPTPQPSVQQKPQPPEKTPVKSKNVSKMVQPLAGDKKRSPYITKVVLTKKGLQEALRDVGINEEPYYFVKRMMINSIITAIVIAAITGYIFYRINLNIGVVVIIAAALGFAFYNMFFNKFVMYPMARARKLGKDIEKDILFATRDLVISMRSGMPLFNAMTAVSTGYGAASLEFRKVVSLIQLGMPIEQAMDEVSMKSQSKTFKRLMLQASVSIKVGADIIGSLQEVVQEITEEREIELRRYGQRLNAIAMFYMIFGIIFPSMGIAIATIMSTFISIFTITPTDLAFVIVGIVGLQVIFLNIITSSRPGFSLE